MKVSEITHNEFITEVIKDYIETKGTQFPDDLIRNAHEKYKLYRIFKGTVICLGETYQSVANVMERMGNQVEVVNYLDSSEKVVLKGSGLSIHARFANNDDLSEILKRHKEHNVSWFKESKDFFCYAAFPILNELEKVTKPAFNGRDRKFKGFMYYPDINELFGTMKEFREYLGITEEDNKSVLKRLHSGKKIKVNTVNKQIVEPKLTFQEMADKLFSDGSVTVNNEVTEADFYYSNCETFVSEPVKEVKEPVESLSKGNIMVGTVYEKYIVTKEEYRTMALRGSNDWSRLTSDELLSILVYVIHSEGSLQESILLLTQLGCPPIEYYREHFKVTTWEDLLTLVGFEKLPKHLKELAQYDVTFFEYFSNGLDLLVDLDDVSQYKKNFKELADNPSLHEPFPSMGKIKEKYGTYEEALTIYYLNQYKLFGSSATSEEDRLTRLVSEFNLLGRPATRLTYRSRYYTDGNSKKYIPLEIIDNLYDSYESYYLAMCKGLTNLNK